MALTDKHIREVIEMLQRKAGRADESGTRRKALLGDPEAKAAVRRWDREDGARPFPRELPDGSEVKELSEVSALMGVDDDIAAHYVLHTPGLDEVLYTEAKLHMMQTGSDFSGSSIIMLRPSWNDAKRIALLNGEDYSALHVTLGFYAEEFTGAKKSALIGIAARLCKEFGPFEARLNGITRFAGKTDDPFVVNVDSPVIEQMRRMVVDLSKKYGLQLDQSHGYTPHLTLGYLDKHESSPLDRWSDQECLFPEINTGFGNRGYDIFALNGKLASKDVWGGAVGNHSGYTSQGGIRARRATRAPILQRRKRPGIVLTPNTPKIVQRIVDMKDEK